MPNEGLRQRTGSHVTLSCPQSDLSFPEFCISFPEVNADTEQAHCYRYSRSRASSPRGLCVGVIQMRITEDCFNSDLFIGKLCKTQLFVQKTRSILMLLVLPRKWIIRVYYCMLDEKRFWESC